MLCGGGVSDLDKKTCMKFSHGTWKQSHTLKNKRHFHSSWNSKYGLLLMGGQGRDKTSELLTSNGQSISKFALKYEAG